MDKKLVNLIEEQINKELYSAYIYLDIAEYYHEKGLNGFHSWFEKQAKEEVEHAEAFMNYLHDNNESFKLKTIEAPNKVYNNLKEPLEYQLTHEKVVTGLIENLYRVAEEAHDLRTKLFLNHFIDEQFEEETTAYALIEKYDLLASEGGLGLYKLDSELSKR